MSLTFNYIKNADIKLILIDLVMNVIKGFQVILMIDKGKCG